MKTRSSHKPFAQQGMVLVSSLLLLIVVTLIAISMFRSFGIQEKIAGNMREKQRALQAAVSAQAFAENWLETNSAGNPSAPCTGPLNANLGVAQICSNTLTTNLSTGAAGVVSDVTVVPWPFQVTYTPLQSTALSMAISTTTSVTSVANPTYYGTPAFYISDMGASLDPNYPGEVYQIDAYAYGGNINTVAVVESTYVVYSTSHQL
jgi:type IV pilus assembly protein PilX